MNVANIRLVPLRVLVIAHVNKNEVIDKNTAVKHDIQSDNERLGSAWTPRLPDCRTLDFLDSWTPELSVPWTLGLPNYRTTGLPDTQTPSLSDC